MKIALCKLTLACLALAWVVVEGGDAQAAVPLVAEPLVPWQQVAAKGKKAAVIEDDEDLEVTAPAPKTAKPAPAKKAKATADADEEESPSAKSKGKPKSKAKQKAEAPRDITTVNREFTDYLKYGAKAFIPFLVLTDAPYAPEVRQGLFVMGLVAPCLTPFGSYIWMPRMLYGNPPPSPANTTALRLGIMATLLWWAPGVGCIFYWVPIVGWVTAIVVGYIQQRIQYAVLPRAINLAYSDAFGGPR
jgi:hypothetical protein